MFGDTRSPDVDLPLLAYRDGRASRLEEVFEVALFEAALTPAPNAQCFEQPAVAPPPDRRLTYPQHPRCLGCVQQSIAHCDFGLAM